MVFFVSDKESGFGKRDIYFMEEKGGVWSEPKNIGGTINSKWDEDAPFMGLDNNVLYFSSNDSTSMGEFDVFMSVTVSYTHLRAHETDSYLVCHSVLYWLSLIHI